MRKSLIDYLLSDECKYTPSERLLLFVLSYAIRAGRDSLSNERLAKATAMHRVSVYRALRGLKAKDAIALNDSTYVIKDRQFARPARPACPVLPSPQRDEGGGTIGGGSPLITQNNNNSINKDARAHEAKVVADGATSATNVADGATSATNVADGTTSATNVREDIAKHNALQKQCTASTVAPERGITSADGRGGRTYRDFSSDETKFLRAYCKDPTDKAAFSALFRQALSEVGGEVGKLVAAARAYTKTLKKNDGNTLYRTAPEKFLSGWMWRDYLPEADSDATSGYTADEQAFLDAYGKVPRDADKFRTMLARSLEGAGSVQALIAAYQDYAEQIRRMDNSLARLPRPENWLEDCGWRDYTRRYCGRVCGPAGGQIDPPAPKSGGFTRLEEGDDAY